MLVGVKKRIWPDETRLVRCQTVHLNYRERIQKKTYVKLRLRVWNEVCDENMFFPSL
jgi:hypothetical protein